MIQLYADFVLKWKWNSCNIMKSLMIHHTWKIVLLC